MWNSIEHRFNMSERATAHFDDTSLMRALADGVSVARVLIISKGLCFGDKLCVDDEYVG